MSEVLDLDIKFMSSLINTYMFVEKSKHLDCFCLLYEFNFKDPKFTHYENKLTNNELFVKNIDLGNKVLYIFKFPEEYLHEYYCLKNSKYSEFKTDAKQLILRFWGQVYSGNPLGIKFLVKLKQILYKEEKLKKEIELGLGVKLNVDQELGEFIELKNETFRESDYVVTK
jgi:hypothetical protein